MRSCEIMVKIVCRCSELKSVDLRYKNLSFSDRICELCDEYAIENAKHVVMQCNYLQPIREIMLNKINDIPDGLGDYIIRNSPDIFLTLMGKPVDGINFYVMFKVWKLACIAISRMYRTVIRKRKGIG